MLYRSSSFKKTARTVTAMTAAAGIFATASLLPSQSAYADEVNKFAAACASIKDTASHAGCMLDAIKKDTQATKEHTARLKQEEAKLQVRDKALDTDIGCLKLLLAYKEKNPAGFEKLGPVTGNNACIAAARIPRPTASLD